MSLGYVIAARAWLLACDICSQETRLPTDHPALNRFLYEWKLVRELKSARGRVTAEQQTWLDRLTAAGTDAAVWRPRDWPDRVLDDLAAIGGHIRRDAAS